MENVNNNVPEEQDFYAPIDPESVVFPEESSEYPVINIDDTEETTEQQEEAAEQQEEQKPPVDPQDPTGKRFSYWQSEAAKAKNELNVLKQQLEILTPYIPVIRYIQENPEIIEKIEGSLGQNQQEPQLQRPTPPPKPANYNPIEAYNDPESESFKWREANEAYREQLADYLLKMEELRQEAFRKAQEERAFIEQRNQQYKQAATILATQYNMSEPDIVEFIQKYSDPKSISLDNLVKLYMLEKGQIQSNQKLNSIAQRQSKKVPLPAGIGSAAETVTQISDEDVFNASIKQAATNNSQSVLWRNKNK